MAATLSGRGMGQGLGTGVSSTATRPEHSEGVVARTIEEQTAKLPSDLFIWAAGASIVGSLVLQFSGERMRACSSAPLPSRGPTPTLLILGLYNKVVKVAGSDTLHR